MPVITARKRRLARIQRTRNHLPNGNDGFSQLWRWHLVSYAALGHSSLTYNVLRSFLRNRAPAVARKAAPDADTLNTGREKCQSCVFSHFLCHQGTRCILNVDARTGAVSLVCDPRAHQYEAAPMFCLLYAGWHDSLQHIAAISVKVLGVFPGSQRAFSALRGYGVRQLSFAENLAGGTHRYRAGSIASSGRNRVA